jgi:hypothetical protein
MSQGAPTADAALRAGAVLRCTRSTPIRRTTSRRTLKVLCHDCHIEAHGPR